MPIIVKTLLGLVDKTESKRNKMSDVFSEPTPLFATLTSGKYSPHSASLVILSPKNAISTLELNVS